MDWWSAGPGFRPRGRHRWRLVYAPRPPQHSWWAGRGRGPGRWCGEARRSWLPSSPCSPEDAQLPLTGCRPSGCFAPACLQARSLAAEVAELFRSVVSLSVKLKATSVPADITNPKQLSELAPCQLSFWVASLFAGNPYQVRPANTHFARLPACLGQWLGSTTAPSSRRPERPARCACTSAATCSSTDGSDAWPPGPCPRPFLPCCSSRRFWRRRRRWGG